MAGFLLLGSAGLGCNIGVGPLNWGGSGGGGGGPCQDSCAVEGQAVCAGPLVKVCRRGADGCLSLFLEECPGSRICVGDACANPPVVWTPMPSGTGAALLAAWGSSATDVFAVGEGGTILHYDGVAWSAEVNVPDVCLGGVWGASGSEVYAFGWGGFLHYDGTAWSALATPAGSVVGYPGCGKLWGSSPTGLFGVGYWVYRFDGVTWSGAVDAPVHGDAVWGSAANDVFVVGDCVYHHDGSTWSTQARCDDWNRYGIWGTGPDDVFVVGRVGGIARYDGSAWANQNSGTKVGLFAVWGSSPAGFFAFGEAGTILRYTP